MDDLSPFVKRLQDLYDEKSNAFRKYFALLVVISLFVLIFMLIPFVYTQNVRNNVIADRDNTIQSINLTNTTVNHYKNAKAAINLLDNRIKNGPSIIEQFIAAREAIMTQVTTPPNVTRSPSVIQAPVGPLEVEQGFKNCNIFPKATENRTECEINTQVEIIFNEYDALINRAIEELREIDNSSQRVVNLHGLEQGANNLTRQFNRTLSENPKFWKTFEEKGKFFLQIDEQVQKFWTTYGSDVDKEIQRLGNNLHNYLQYEKNLKIKISQLNETQSEIKKRLQDFESPIGKLSIGFDDLVTFFPAGLLAGFLLVNSILVDTIIIRRRYFKAYPIKDYDPKSNPDDAKLNPKDVTLISSLWLDPQDNKQNKKIRWLVLFLPSVIFFVSVIMIVFSWSLAETSLGGAPEYRPVALFLYIISGIIVTFVNYIKIKQAITN